MAASSLPGYYTVVRGGRVEEVSSNIAAGFSNSQNFCLLELHELNVQQIRKELSGG
jgi:hypothetical protein